MATLPPLDVRIEVEGLPARRACARCRGTGSVVAIFPISGPHTVPCIDCESAAAPVAQSATLVRDSSGADWIVDLPHSPEWLVRPAEGVKWVCNYPDRSPRHGTGSELQVISGGGRFCATGTGMCWLYRADIWAAFRDKHTFRIPEGSYRASCQGDVGWASDTSQIVAENRVARFAMPQLFGDGDVLNTQPGGAYLSARTASAGARHLVLTEMEEQ